MQRNIILPVVLCGLDTRSLTLREDDRMSVLDNGELREIVVPEREEVRGDWRISYNTEIYDL